LTPLGAFGSSFLRNGINIAVASSSLPGSAA
jgi:hypothetical protein